ncbi:hypothetical protein CEP51_002764 [Fusarium floridanum]|uniref:Nephrocystin 3-like N-terminal domain-containing protein n=1 Tax=Fusarium floridanum TaxID=1325733 RepID=A0A428S9Q9_9HYPO|nr:hypothetical protein CEP51_002764 [Fusarium floridanum]
MDTQVTVSNNGRFPPGPGLPDPTLESLEEIWSSLVPGLQNNPSVYEEAVGEFVNSQKAAVEEAEQRASQMRTSFIDILEKWDKEHDAKPDKVKSRWPGKLTKGNDSLMARVRADISKQHSWEDVLAALREAESHYSSSSGLKVVHTWFRKAADKSAIVEPYVNFIPNGTYTSVICAGLTFVLKACAAAKKFRDESFDLINRLPDKIDMVNQYSELYEGDLGLQSATYDLYSEILHAIQGLMYWLLKDHTFEFLKVLGLQSAYDPLKGRLEEVGKKSARVEEAVRLCDSKKLAEIGKGVDGIQQNFTALRNQFLEFVRVAYLNSKWFEQLLEAQKRTAGVGQQKQPMAYISDQELLTLLLRRHSSDHESSQTVSLLKSTLEQVLRAGFRMDGSEQARTRWIMNDKSVSDWFQSTESRKLLVNGNHTLERIAPTSFFCSILVQSLKSVESIIVLAHFCGLNTTRESERSSNAGLLRDLTGQLIEQWKFGDLTCLDQETVKKLKRESPKLRLKTQRRLLRTLITALPQETPLFIFIDGINYNETEELVYGTKKAVKDLCRLIDEEGVGAMVKVFVTSAVRAFDVNEYFDEDEVITIPEGADENTSGFIDMQFESGLGAQVAKLRGPGSASRGYGS